MAQQNGGLTKYFFAI